MGTKDSRGRTQEDFSVKDRKGPNTFQSEDVDTSNNSRKLAKRVLAYLSILILITGLMYSYNLYVVKKARSQNSNEYIVSLENKISELNKNIEMEKREIEELETEISQLKSALKGARGENEDKINELRREILSIEELRDNWKFRFCKSEKFEPLECQNL